MKFEVGSTIIVSTGNKIITLNDDTIDVTDVFFSIEEPNDSGTLGWTDITTNYTRNILYNEVSTSNALKHYENIGGTKTLTCAITTSAGDFSTTGEFGFNVGTLSGNHKVYFLVRGT